MRRYPVIVAVVFFAGFGAYWSYGNIMQKAATTVLDVSGTIEAENVAVVSEVSGRVAELVASEGQTVVKGQVLVRLDDLLLKAQQEQADSAVKTAEAALAKVKAGARSEEIDASRAALVQAIAVREGAKSGWESAKAILNNPQDLNARVDAAKARVASSEAQLNLAKAALAVAETNRDAYEWKVSGQDRSIYLSYAEQAKAGEEGVKAAISTLEGAKQDLENLQQIKANPQTALADVDAAEARYATAEAAVAVAQARLSALGKGATTEQIAVAESQVRQAKAAAATVKVMSDKMSPTAPASGVVLKKSIALGEIVQPGSSILSLANLEKVTLKVYIPEDQLGKVRLGQKVLVKVDSFPGQTFEGQISSIASNAEFTPRNIQTKDQRVNTVYAVKIGLANPEMKLKPGMPADAQISTSES